MKNLKVGLSIFVSLVLMLTTFLFVRQKEPLAASAYEFEQDALLADNLDIFADSDGDGFYILSKNDSKTTLLYFSASDFRVKARLNLEFAYTSAGYCSGNLYVLNSINTDGDSWNQKITKYKFNSTDDSFTNEEVATLTNVNCDSKESFCVGKEDSFAIIKGGITPTKASITLYYFEKDPIMGTSELTSREIKLGSETFVSIFLDPPSEYMYAVTNSGKLTKIPFSNAMAQPEVINENWGLNSFKFLTEDIVHLEPNTVRSLSGGFKDFKLELTKDELTSLYYPSAILDNYVLGKVSADTIYCYEKDAQSEYVALNKIVIEGQDILNLATSTSGEVVAILKNKSNSAISALKITKEKMTLIENDPGGGELEDISSIAYKVDNKQKIIGEIPVGTTAAVFKENVDYQGYSVKFTNYMGKNILSGRLGTGATAYFSTYDNSKQLEYKLIVPGDLTGEGNVNSRDLTVLINHLLGKEILKAPLILLAADINRDGIVDTVDLLLMDRMRESSN